MSLTVKDYKTTSLFNDKKNGREQSGLCWKKNPQGKATDGLAPRRTTPSYLSGSEITAPSKEAQYSRGTEPMRATWDATRKPVSSNIHMDPKFSSSTRSWNNRPSTSDSASKKVKEDKDNEVDIKWTKDDTRFRTCDSVTSSSTPKPPSSDSVPRKPSSSVKNERLSFSQKSIINSIETMTRKSANIYMERGSTPSQSAQNKENKYTKLSSSSKYSYSNQNLQESEKPTRVDIIRLMRPLSNERKTSLEKKPRQWPSNKKAVQTKDELKGLITQGMSKNM
jgi:hypothetical protein